jgi:hypothetical protein
MIELDNLKLQELDELLGKKVGLSGRTIRRYRNSVKDNVIPATGEIHLYKAIKLYVFLKEYETFKNENGENESELYNRAELLLQSIESLESHISLLDKEDLQTDIKNAVKNSIKRDIDTIKEIIKSLL